MSSFYENNSQKHTLSNQPSLLYQSASRQNQHFSPAPQQSTQPRRLPPMPKNQAREIADKWKRWLVIVSLLSFGTLGALVLGNTSTAKTTSSSSSSQSNPTSTSGGDSTGSDSIFQQGSDGFGFGNQQGGQPVTHSSGS